MAIVWDQKGGKVPFSIKPAAPSINWGSPLTTGLVFATDYAFQSASNGLDLVLNTKGTYSGTTSQQVGTTGGQRNFNTGTDAYTTNGIVNGLSQISVEILFYPASGAGGTVFGKGSTASTGGSGFGFFEIGYFANNLFVDVGWQTTDAEWFMSNIVEQSWNHCVITYDGSSTANVPAMYLNGVAQTISTNASPAGVRVADNTVLNIANAASRGNLTACTISYVRIRNRIINPQEVLELYSNPWQIYRQPLVQTATNLPATGSVSGSIAVTEAQDTFAATGSVIVSGTVAVTEGNDSLAATGSVIVAGIIAVTEIQDNLAATGTLNPMGVIAVTEGNDAFAATGTVTQPVINGSASLQELIDSFSAIGNNGVVDTGDPGLRKRNRAEADRLERDRKRRARMRGQVIDAFERIVEGKSEIPPEIADEILTGIEREEDARLPDIDMAALLANADRVQKLWNAYIDRDDEDILVLL